ncbi:winged helix-turn-helix domain-containing protein [Halorubellus salinus]|uniref:winged helix-turn-helix domain-containing protein n=1 Tax=Halorubellus salinus TaxID=755309 RepID=UPI001D086AFF|nr:winged helix-turn-helix domain-containing protein [Halorubellus salinus]
MSEDEIGRGTEAGDGVATEEVSAASAFELVAHETRVGVLDALREADGGPLSFGEIRTAVGVEDPGQCHYHVDRLVGRFVRKTEDGYVLSPAGWRLVGAIVSGGVTASLEPGSVPAAGSCSECGGSLRARLREGGVAIECVECGFVQADPDVPAGALAGWERSAIPAVVGRYVSLWEVAASHGFCPNCEGRVDRGVRRPGESASANRPAAPAWFEGEDADALVVTACRGCGFWWHAAVSIAALSDPAVVGFHHEHGIDLRERPWWTLDHLPLGECRVVDDPRRVHVRLALDDDVRTFTFDGDFELVDVERE